MRGDAILVNIRKTHFFVKSFRQESTVRILFYNNKEIRLQVWEAYFQEIEG
jgi:hypothetical protein